MRVHLLGLPNSRTTSAYALDGFAMMTLRFAEVLKRLGSEVILYGVGLENEAPCTEFVSCLTADEQAAFLGEIPYQRVQFDAGCGLFLTFNARAAGHLRGIKRPKDIIATIGGSSQHAVWQQSPELTCLEYSVGYRGVFAPFRVYQSHIWRHVVHGFTGCDGGREFDAVIPPFYEIDSFPSSGNAGDYALFCGRLDLGKGIRTACDAARAAGIRLVIIGHGDPQFVSYGEYLGAVDVAERNRLLAGARCVLMPTQYIEPFGNVCAEAQLCGTPVISTDYGAFVESIEQGITGYRCAYLGEFVQAIERSQYLDRAAIRARARRLWSMETATDAYRAYFARLALLHGDGWETVAPLASPISVPVDLSEEECYV